MGLRALLDLELDLDITFALSAGLCGVYSLAAAVACSSARTL